MTPTQREAALRLADAIDGDSGDCMEAAALLRELAAEPDPNHFVGTMAEQLIQVIAGIWTEHPDYSLRQTLEALNALMLPAESVQEPVGWWNEIDGEFEHSHKPWMANPTEEWRPLYTAPQQRKPLSDSDLLRLARRCLWLAYVWNDHNFQDPPHKYARDEARALGIDSFEDANYWLEATHAEITGEQK